MHYVCAALGVSTGTQALGTIALISLVGAAGGAVAIYVRSMLAFVASCIGTPPAAQRPTAAADISVLLGQSDPDADGHPRPRAPGRGLAVAIR